MHSVHIRIHLPEILQDTHSIKEVLLNDHHGGHGHGGHGHGGHGGHAHGGHGGGVETFLLSNGNGNYYHYLIDLHTKKKSF